MDLDKLPSNTTYSYAHLFYPVGNLRGGFAWDAIQPSRQMNHMLDLPEFNIVRNEKMQPTPSSIYSETMGMKRQLQSSSSRRTRKKKTDEFI
jgi:hypothetical protein